MEDVLRDIGVIARALDTIANIEFKDLTLTKGQYSNEVALQNFSEEEIHLLKTLLVKMRENIDSDWQFVKNGNKREY